MKKHNKSLSSLSFEEAIQELDGIVSQMQAGTLSLDDMLSAYKRGAELTHFCRDKLNQAQLEIKKLEKNNLVDYDNLNE
ncbi:MAG: exodeoxyribonuclease VII small subunit [Proteobacteria bacterium]|nr:exodeoxyribonuclease VII small subunit [Pseudomonadota bacterium]MCH9757795.1 exodeoxyribonuclease VII small subunit [Pseudomonadota bacterium]